MIKELKMNGERPNGVCSVCGKVDLLYFHHIIPKRLRVKTNRNTQLLWGNNGKIFYTQHTQKVEHLMIPVCRRCHNKLHPENMKFLRNEMEMRRLEREEWIKKNGESEANDSIQKDM